ncbi:MAG: prolyl aminopeptidase [Elusimicrobia bacterium]|nr:MAG: prolyl aminopeptidase [Elusimicrobiota bacterium]
MTRELYPEIEPYREGMLKVSELHTVHWEECGNPDGKPVVFLHGGPGGGIDPAHRRYFDPKKWRVILFDQRGCGRSTPYAELRENTTWDLVADIEKLRVLMGVERWVVFGGSWGSTLALAYAETHPARVKALILRGIFALRRRELLWFYQDGTSLLYPDAFEPYRDHIPVEERGDMMAAYHRRLTSEDRAVRMAAAKAWSVWEGATSKLLPDPGLMDKFAEDKHAEAFARIECHYFVNKGFFEHDDQLIHDAARLKGIPGVIIHGRYDVVCPLETAWLLHKAWPDGELKISPDSGHAMSEPANRTALLDATDRFAAL